MAKVYIDFDSIFDTRIVLLQQLSRPAAKRLAKDRRYFDRLNDDFWNTDNAIIETAWKEIWENRGKEIKYEGLVMTDVIVELYQERIERDNLMASGLDISKDTCVINLWPYTIEKEAEESLAEEMMSCGFVSIEFINIDPKKLEASFFHAGYRQVIMYDMNYWLTNNWRTVAEDPLIKTRFISPLFLKGQQQLSMPIETLATRAHDELKPYMIYNPVPSNMFCFMVK